MQGGYVYIMSNGPSGTLYIGVTADPAARVHAHRQGRGSDFCGEHGLTRLVYIEAHDTIVAAITREKAMKKWRRACKLDLIGRANPKWDDLFETINQ